jgi:hypothetical protein
MQLYKICDSVGQVGLILLEQNGMCKRESGMMTVPVKRKFGKVC